jgi:microcystin-dependent protein
MPTTPTWQLPYPLEAEPADVPVDMQELCVRLETVLSQVRASGSIPGEVKLWPGGVLPTLATYGHWVWADGTSYVTATYPLASANIAAAWKTAHGQADPGAGNFRVPDLRGLSPTGLDQMPGGARANRTTRAVAITIAGRTGEEYHTIAVAEMPGHAHGLAADSHTHTPYDPTHTHAAAWGTAAGAADNAGNRGANTNQTVQGFSAAGLNGAATGISLYAAASGVVIASAGGGGAHENVPPTVYVPWIVKLDD